MTVFLPVTVTSTGSFKKKTKLTFMLQPSGEVIKADIETDQWQILDF